MSESSDPALSIVVPTFNDADVLLSLLMALERQDKIDFELIIVDGGSDDGVIALVLDYATRVGFPVFLLHSAPGRGRQLNAGAERARGNTLLFLHADSGFADPYALADGLFYFDQEVDYRRSEALVGRFALRFLRSDDSFPLGYAYYESKARLPRRGCIHGDQGMMIRKSFFARIGPFNSELPFLEDERFAETVWAQGEWLLLPAEILTSARRFESEGMLQRQVLNALILNALAIGWDRFLREAPDLYRRQDKTGKLDLLPFFAKLGRLLKEFPWTQRWRVWYRTGTYVRDNGWQVLLALDVWWGLRRQANYRGERTPLLTGIERWYDRFSDHTGGRLLATGGVWCWFRLALPYLIIRRKCRKIFVKKEVPDFVDSA